MTKVIALTLLFLTLSGCQMGYILKNAYHQARLLKKAVPLEDVLENEKIAPEIKRKLQLASEAKKFAETHLALKQTKNYSTYVQLDGPYVTYVVSAAPKNELTYFTWWFPIVGSVPYKGYFNSDEAKALADDLKQKNYDTYVRGVSAFSTLGWFRDPLLSSMTAYEDYDLVNTIIHETVHATIYISSNANFNERLATFLGDVGAQLFYEKKDPTNYEKIKEIIANENHDQKLFAHFISNEIKKLEDWYQKNKNSLDLLTKREIEFENIKKNFSALIKPKLKTKKFEKFDKSEINNARLLGFKLYMNDLEDFEKLKIHFNSDFSRILSFCKSLEKEEDPELALKNFIGSH
jgi:predicted aminopeptidase